MLSYYRARMSFHQAWSRATKYILLLVCACIGLLAPAKAQPTNCIDYQPLEIEPEDIVSGKRKDKLLVLINFAKVWSSLTLESRNCAILVTARSVATDKLSRSEFAKLPSATVIVALVKNMDEYARPNYGGMTKFGTISFSRKAGDVELESWNVRLD